MHKLQPSKQKRKGSDLSLFFSLSFCFSFSLSLWGVFALSLFWEAGRFLLFNLRKRAIGFGFSHCYGPPYLCIPHHIGSKGFVRTTITISPFFFYAFRNLLMFSFLILKKEKSHSNISNSLCSSKSSSSFPHSNVK